jgi:LmbE family N-acetylglucosaminyl deacetylase
MEQNRMALCAVFAHPDDESFGMAGTLARYSSLGYRCGVICATHGEAGKSHGLASSPAELARVRAIELFEAMKRVGVDDVALWDLPDGGGADYDPTELQTLLRLQFRRWQPVVVVTFDRFGVTRHPDHMAVHDATSALVKSEGRLLGIQRLFYQVVTCPEDASPEGPGLACVSASDIDVTIDISQFEDVKRDALGAHASQADDTALLLSRPPGSLVAEHYQFAWSADQWRPGPAEAELLEDSSLAPPRL